MSSQFKNRSKRKLFEELLASTDVFVQVNPLKEEVELPAKFEEHPSIALKMSNAFNFQPEVNDKGIVATLKFGEEYFTCVLPWESIWGVYTESGENKIWKEDVPTKLLAMHAIGKIKKKIFPQKVSKENSESPTSSSESQGSKLKSVKKPELTEISGGKLTQERPSDNYEEKSALGESPKDKRPQLKAISGLVNKEKLEPGAKTHEEEGSLDENTICEPSTDSRDTSHLREADSKDNDSKDTVSKEAVSKGKKTKDAEKSPSKKASNKPTLTLIK